MLLRRQSWLASRPSAAPLTRLWSDASSAPDCTQSDADHTLASAEGRLLGAAVVVEEPTDASADMADDMAGALVGELVPYVSRGYDMDRESSNSGQDSAEHGVRFNPRRPVPYVLYISMVRWCCGAW